MTRNYDQAPAFHKNTLLSLARNRNARALGALMMVTTLLGVSGCDSADNSATNETAVQVVTYHGRDLLCREETGSYSEPSYDCDFAGYYERPHYEAPSDLQRISAGTLRPITVQYQGGTLTCLVYNQDHDTYGETCDYSAFYAAEASRQPK